MSITRSFTPVHLTERLVIFISHRFQSRDAAETIARALYAIGGDRILVHYSGKYTFDIYWRENIERDLTEASWLLLLYERPHMEYDWWLFETGFFRGKMDAPRRNCRLICLYKPSHVVPPPLQSFFAIPAAEKELGDLFRDIYVNKPWKVNTNLFQENPELVSISIERIISAVIGTE
jgi:hypothetical protein